MARGVHVHDNREPQTIVKGRRIMTFGMTTFTFVHVLLSLIGIFSGFVVVFGLLVAKRLDGWTTPVF